MSDNTSILYESEEHGLVIEDAGSNIWIRGAGSENEVIMSKDAAIEVFSKLAKERNMERCGSVEDLEEYSPSDLTKGGKSVLLCSRELDGDGVLDTDWISYSHRGIAIYSDEPGALNRTMVGDGLEHLGFSLFQNAQYLKRLKSVITQVLSERAVEKA